MLNLFLVLFYSLTVMLTMRMASRQFFAISEQIGFGIQNQLQLAPSQNVIKYANRYTQKVKRHQAIDNSKVLPNLGNVKLKVLWPPYSPGGAYNTTNENNNSIVLAITLGNASFILTGDCEADNWPLIADSLPAIPGIGVFKVPHHGAVNGVFSKNGSTPWLDVLPVDIKYAISSHIVPFSHPATKVIQEFTDRQIQPFRTDLHYHLIFAIDGTVDPAGAPNVTVQWSHI